MANAIKRGSKTPKVSVENTDDVKIDVAEETPEVADVDIDNTEEVTEDTGVTIEGVGEEDGEEEVITPIPPKSVKIKMAKDHQQH